MDDNYTEAHSLLYETTVNIYMTVQNKKLWVSIKNIQQFRQEDENLDTIIIAYL